MTPDRPRAEGVIVVAVGYVLVRAFWLLSSSAGRAFDSLTIEATAKLVLWGCAGFPIALWLARRHAVPVSTALGLGPGILRGLGFGLIATLPMVAALFVVPLKPFDPDLAFGSGLLGPFAEELLFRGFLFGLLWRVAKWSVWSSILISSMLFGLAHVAYADRILQTILSGPSPWRFSVHFRGDEVIAFMGPVEVWWRFVESRGASLALTVLPLAAGGAVLGWITYRWNSIWPAISLHACMNLWWDLTRGEHARPTLGLDVMSVAQVVSVVLALLMSLRRVDTR